MKPLIAALSFLCSLLQVVGANAQGFPPGQPPLQQISVDPVLGPICQGPLGPGRCEDVQRFLLIEQVASQIPVQQIGFDPNAGPICAGPLGPGPCRLVQRFLAMQQLAPQQYPLQPIGTLPNGVVLCMGPLGPGPCDAIRNYLMQQQPGAPPLQSVDPSRPQLINATSTPQPMCNGPVGPTPCNLVGQMSLDRLSGQVPAPATFGVAQGGDPQRTPSNARGASGLM